MQAQLRGLDEQIAGLEQQQERLIQSEKQLQAKIEAFRSQKEVIKAEYSAAEAQVRIGEAATGIGEQMADTGLAIERARDKTEQMQARASAIEELTAAGTLEDFTERQDPARPRARGPVLVVAGRLELERLKAELGAGEKQKELEQ